MAQATILSTNDSSVLNALFDPEASLSGGVAIDESVPQNLSKATFSKLQERERIIEDYPQYASAWNNRAQARRMLFESEEILNRSEELEHILQDIGKAISLASPPTPTTPVSSSDARVLASAHTHKAYLFWLASRSETGALKIGNNTAGWREMDKDRLEELASREFALGGRYGNDTAKQLAVKTNPYAKLCGSIVKEAMQKEIADHYQIPVASISAR